MIKKLRRRFVLVSTAAIFVVMALLVAGINLTSVLRSERSASEMLEMLSSSGGFPAQEPGGPRKPSGSDPEERFRTRWFSVGLTAEGEVYSSDTLHIAAIDTATAVEYARRAVSAGGSGYISSYKYLVVPTASGSLAVFLDRADAIRGSRELFGVSLAIALCALAATAGILRLLSGRAVRPFAESYEKQKRFISDAGHEIKTPLSIISANADVLEQNSGESEWTQSIKNQTRRLSALVKSLLTLSRLDEGQCPRMLPLSLSDAVREELEPFVMLAELSGRTLVTDIADGVSLEGNGETLRRMVSVMADNAVKYSPEGAQITAKLYRSGKNAVFTVWNPCENPPEGRLDRLFDRFYRDDASRARETGGYGLGLSIAKAAVTAHRGKISAARENGGIRFTAVLPA